MEPNLFITTAKLSFLITLSLKYHSNIFLAAEADRSPNHMQLLSLFFKQNRGSSVYDLRRSFVTSPHPAKGWKNVSYNPKNTVYKMRLYAGFDCVFIVCYWFEIIDFIACKNVHFAIFFLWYNRLKKQLILSSFKCFRCVSLEVKKHKRLLLVFKCCRHLAQATCLSQHRQVCV